MVNKGSGKPRVVSQGTGARLSVKEACDIIEVCNRNKVSSLSFGGLTVTFHKTLDEQADAGPGQTRSEHPRVTKSTDELLEEARRQRAALQASEEDAKKMEEVEARALYLEELKVTNPLAWEREMEMESLNGKELTE